MSFTTPLALLLFVTLPFIIWLGWPANHAYRKARDRASVVVRAIIVTCLILALAGAQMVQTADELAVVFLIDGSDSITPEQALAAENFVREAIENMQPQDSAAVIVFGANALVDRPISRLASLSSITSIPQTLHTDLAEAIRLGLAIFPAGTARRIVILSDGAATIGDTDAAGRLAAANGVPVDYVPLLRNASDNEVWLSNVSAPTRINEGELFTIDVAAESRQPTSATLRILAGGQIISEEDVQLNGGTNNFSIRLQASEQEFSQYTIQIAAAEDTYYQNNQLAAFTNVTGPPRILIVSSDGTVDDLGQPLDIEAAQLQDALIATGLIVDHISPTDLPSNFAELSNYASIVLTNVNAKRLSPRKMEALQTYVRDLGGGLVAIGGPESFAMGGYYRTPLEELLPIDMQIQDEERFPSVSLVIVIDRSGSMGAPEGGLTKIQLAAEGAVRVAELLNDFDEMTVIPVDTQPDNPIGPFLGSERVTAIEQIRRIGAGGGGIYVATGLDAAIDALAESNNQVKHIIILADGNDAEEKQGVPEKIDRLVEEGITISAVSIGNGKDLNWLQDMAARGNGRFHFTDRAANLPQIFTQETTSIQRSYLVEERFFPTLGRSSPILSSIQQVPALDGYVGATPKSTAQVVLKTHLDDPLLTTWQYGLGRSVAWTSDATSRWAGDWVAWEGFPLFWAQTVRWTISEGRNNAVETVVDYNDSETAVLTVNARTPGGGYLNDLVLEASVVDPAGEGVLVNLQQVAPGRYQGEFVPSNEGAYFIRVAGSDPAEEIIIGQTSGWVLGYSPEYSDLDANPQALARLAEQTNGRNLGDLAAAAFEHNLESAPTTRPIWPTLLLIAVLLLPFDIGIRRLVITRRDRERAWASTFGRLQREEVDPAPRSSQMSSLFQAKERAQSQRPAPPGERDTIERMRPPTPPPSYRAPESESNAVPSSAKNDPPAAAGSSSLASRLLERRRQQDNSESEE